MQRLANVMQLGVKELRSLWYDKVLLIFLIWAFSFGIYDAATGQSSELRNAPIAVVDEDRSPLTARILGAFHAPHFLVPERISPQDVDPGLDTGRYTFTLHIPSGFQRDVLAGHQPAIQLNIDATRMDEAFIGAGYIQNIVTDEITRFVQQLRQADLYKLPGVAETLDWAAALQALDQTALDPETVTATIGVLLSSCIMTRRPLSSIYFEKLIKLVWLDC